MGWRGYGYSEWAPYVPVAERKAKAQKSAAALAKQQGRELSPLKIAGRKIATSFWGLAWCDNLNAYSDFANRLPRGATYVRNGSVVDLLVKPGKVEALVAGSETYKIEITVDALPKAKWNKIKQDCSASIDSLLDLLAGRFSDSVMKRLTNQKEGLFPAPKEIKMSCSCPDYSYCCKHLAAVMYGIGSRLDKQPELLFALRKVDHQELVTHAVANGNLDRELSANSAAGSLAGEDLGAMFGIELDTPTTAPIPSPKSRTRGAKKSAAVNKITTTKKTGLTASAKPGRSKAASKPAIDDAPNKNALAKRK